MTPLLPALLLLVCVSSHAAVRLPANLTSGENLYSGSQALLIGVSDYQHWPDLPGVRDDIAAVGSALRKHGFGVTMLENPDRAAFDDGVRRFIAQHGAQPQGRLLIWFAGHGHTLTTHRGRQLGYLVPADAPLPDTDPGGFRQRAVSMLEVEIHARQMESKHALFLFDACFSGSLFEITRAVPPAISEKTAEPVRQFITAGDADQEVPDNSIFRREFVRALDGEGDLNADGYITGTELAQYLGDRVTNYSRRAQTPRYGKIRDPLLDRGDFVFTAPSLPSVAKRPAAATSQTPTASPTENEAAERLYWESIRNSGEPALFEAYLADYPNGRFSRLARILAGNRPPAPPAPETGDVLPPKPEPTQTTGHVLVIAKGEVGSGSTMDPARFSAQLADTTASTLAQTLDMRTTVLDDPGLARELQYEHDDRAPSRKACNDHGGDWLISAQIEINHDLIGPEMVFSAWDCKAAEHYSGRGNVDEHINDNHRFERALRRDLTAFVRRIGVRAGN